MSRSLPRWARGCVWVLGLVPPLLAGQEPAGPLETVVTTGSRLSAGTTPSLTVLDRQTIVTRNDPDVLRLLGAAPGIHVSLPGGLGPVGSLFLRGAEANFTAVLIDGIQVNDPTNSRGGSFDLSALSPAEIERIEIVRGPQSSVYGSDALGGVINVVTRSSDQDALTIGAGAEIGNRDRESATVRVGGVGVGAGRLHLGLGTFAEGEPGDAGRYRRQTMNAGWVTQTERGASLSVSMRHGEADARAFPDASGGPRLAVLRERERRESVDDSIGVTLRSELSARTDLDLVLTGFRHEERMFSPGVMPGVLQGLPASRADSDFSRIALNVFAVTAWSPSLQSVLGVARQGEEGDSDGEIFLAPALALPTRYRLTRRTTSVYGEMRLDPTEALAVSAAVRADDYREGASQTTGRITVQYSMTSAMRAHLSFGQGFKLPSFFSLGHPLVGNPALEPETADSVELGMQGQAGNGRLEWRAAWFEQRFEDLIDFDFETFRAVNVSRVDMGGLELSLEARLGERIVWSSHATLLDIDTHDPGTRLTHRPERWGEMSVRFDLTASLTAHASWRHVGPRFDSAVPTGERTLPSYDRLDLTLSRRWQGLELGVSLDNVLDERFEEAIGFPDPGRTLRLSVWTAIEPSPGR